MRLFVRLPVGRTRFASGRVHIAFILGLTMLLFSSPQDISEYENRLKDINSQIESIRAQIGRLDKQKTSALSRLSRMGFEKALLKKEMDRLALQVIRTTEELDTIKAEIIPLEKKIRRDRESVAKTLVTLYKYGRLTYVDLFLRVKDLSELITENKNLGLLARHQNEQLNEYLFSLNRLREAVAQQERKRRELDGLFDESRGKTEDLERQEKETQILIDRITTDQTQFENALKEKSEQARQLQDLIDSLARQEYPQDVALIPMYEKKGELPWPLEGRVVTTYGVKQHPRFKTRTVDNGIEIAGRENMIVKSVHPGVVALSDYVPGYGNLLIIDHGMGYHTLYGHCSELLVQRGDAVHSFQPIAVIGDIDSLKGTTLYFEIRYQTKPVDPLQWLRGR